MVALLALALATPAMAGLKLTSKGRMDVSAIWLSNNHFDLPGPFRNDQNEPVDWIQQELVIRPTLHINEKVRIHSRITILERVWNGRGVNNPFPGDFAENDYRGATNFWVERLWLSFPLFGGTLHVGRQGAGAWAYPFGNNTLNGDRVKYVRRVGPITLIPIYEKRVEPDGTVVGLNAGQAQTPLGTAFTGGPFSTSGGDGDDYYLAAIIPISKKPLIVSRQLVGLLNRDGGAGGRIWIWFPTLMVKAGIFQFDFEANYLRWHLRQVLPDSGDELRDWDAEGLRMWAEAGLHPGPFDFVLGGFWVHGTASRDQSRSLAGTGGDFEPLLLLFSEDMGALWNSTGVFNSSAGTSGYKSVYFRAGYKINDTMKVTGILGFLWADKMLYGAYGANTINGGRDKWTTPDTFLGWEVDLGFRWDFMDNIAYVLDAGFFKPGPYWNGALAFNADRSVFGFRNMLVISW